MAVTLTEKQMFNLVTQQTYLKSEYSAIQDLLMNDLKKNYPSLYQADDLVNSISDVRYQWYVTNYDVLLEKTKGVEDIPDDIKFFQSFLFDNFVLAINKSTFKSDVYSMKPALINGDFEPDLAFIKSCVGVNQEGRLSAYRYDVEEYKYGDSPNITLNPKKTNKNSQIDMDNYYIIPLVNIMLSTKLLQKALSTGNIYKVIASTNDEEKIRYISTDRDMLVRFSDFPDIMIPNEIYANILKGYLYAPVLGAPITTSMVTRLDLSSMESIHKVSYEELSKNVEKPTNSVLTLLIENKTGAYIDSLVKEIEITGDSKYVDALNKLVFEDIIGYKDYVKEDGKVSSVTFSHYMHSLSNEDKNKVLSSILKTNKEVHDFVSNLVANGRFKGVKVYDKDKFKDKSEVVELLKNNLVIAIARSKDGKLYSSTGTLSNDILKMALGDDYFSRFESLSSRVDRFIYLYFKSSDISFEDLIKYCGLDTKGYSKIMKKHYLEAEKTSTLHKEDIMSELTEGAYKSRTTSSDSYSDIFIMKSIFASVDSQDNVSKGYITSINYTALKRLIVVY